MKNSTYCYSHSFGKFKGVPFLKNPITHIFSILTILSFFLTLYSLKTGGTFKNQERIEGKLDTSHKKLDELKSIVEPKSLQDTEGLSYDERQAYKAIISKIFNDLKPHAKVQIDDSIQGVDSKKNHKIDISIRANIEGEEILTIIKTNAGKTPIDEKEVKRTYSILNDIRASKGIIISNTGFTQSAKHLAPSYGIELSSISDAKSKNWKGDVKIPVLYLALRVDLRNETVLHLDVGDSIPRDSNKWIISMDGGKSETSLMKLFSHLWNKNKITHSEGDGITHQVTFDADKIHVLVGNNKWTKANKFILKYRVERDGYLKYFEATEYKAIKSHLTGNIEPTTDLAVKIGPISERFSWHKINDIDDMIKRTKGYSIRLTESSEKIKDHGYKGNVLLKKLD